MINYKTKPGGVATGKQVQLKYTDKAKADKQLQVLAVPDKVIASAVSAQFVGKGNLLRVLGTTNGYIAFGDVNMAAPTITTQTALRTNTASFFFIIATNDYVRTSVEMRIEVTED